MKVLSDQELDTITRTKHGILPNVCLQVVDGQHALPFIQLNKEEAMPDGYESASVVGILLYLSSAKGLVRPVIDVRHGDPARAARQVIDALNC